MGSDYTVNTVKYARFTRTYKTMMQAVLSIMAIGKFRRGDISSSVMSAISVHPANDHNPLYAARLSFVKLVSLSLK